MSENTTPDTTAPDTTAPADAASVTPARTERKRNLWVDLAIVAVIALIFGVSFALGNHFLEGTEFGGTDAAATEALKAAGYKPWFSPIFEPASGEVESGLFALQAALGAGLLGFALGWYRAKNKFSGASAE